jgi:hypothetical protein
MTYASVTVNVDVDVDVDVDLSEISTDDLIEELKDRNMQPGSSTEDCRELLEKIHQALVFNDTEKAIAISRTLIYNALGAIC